MLRVAYLFERFPSFGQNFCYREVAELIRQGAELSVYSIRQPAGETPEAWAPEVVRRVNYLPGEKEIVAEIERARRAGKLPAAAVRHLQEWDRQTDFLRLYQAAYVGLQLREAGIGRVHAHFAGMAARTAYWIREFFEIPFSLTAHANDIFAPRPFVVSLEKILESAAAIVTVSDFSAKDLRERFPSVSAKVHRVYNGVDPALFQSAAIVSGVPILISIGRLIEKKGYRDLISACAALRAGGQDFRCEIYGEGPLQNALAEQIAAEHLEEVVLLAGPRSQAEIAARLTEASLFVLPCTTEADGGMDNLPTVIMEAMASGLPVVSTTLAGVPEMVIPGETGVLVAPDDPAALTRAMADLLAEPETMRRLGANGRALAERKFSIAANAAALAEILAR